MKMMSDQGYKFNIIVEHFPVKAKEFANSIHKTIPELKKLILEGVYYIDGNCELIEQPLNKALYEFGLSIKKQFPPGQDAYKRLATTFKVVKNKSVNRGSIGTAGEDLELGVCVVFGEDGKTYRSNK